MNKLIKKNSLIFSLLFFTLLVFTQLVFTQPGFAADEAETNSNIKNFSYPAHHCKSKPVRPVKPENFSPQDDVEKYNNEISRYNIIVSDYNDAIKLYKACINQYIKNGNNDINTIRQQLNAALKEARSQ